ncbi:MAG: DNA replication/repair protein RecF [Oscillospiraceae bacterium]|jgi:DNA replication and repair protein RecF|nr:DNA replication/repair protein RecF [Oscillospiraceae bacterium]
MRVKRVELRRFRNYAEAEFEPDAGITVLCGRNAQGKTNLIEAIVLCSVGRSHRTKHDRELIQWNESKAVVGVETENRDGTHDVKIVLSQGGGRGAKQALIGSSPAARIGELMGHVPSVLFSPEDLGLVREGPGERRRFIDMMISQIRPQYFYALQQYSRALKQRNGLLRELAWKGIEEGKAEGLLEPWDEMVAEAGGRIVRGRKWFVKRLGEVAREAHGHLSTGDEALGVRYVCSWGGMRSDGDGDGGGDGDGETDVGMALLDGLRQGRGRDLAARSTGVGPHRDDIELTLNRKEARVYASQGQQRTAAIALKLAGLSTLKDELGETPVLLLDDVMSELDAERRRRLLTWMEGVQTIITCTDADDVRGASVGKFCAVRGGEIG